MAVYKNISGIIRRVDETGTGLVSPTTPVGAHCKDVFFNKDAVDDSITWSQLSVGLKVEMPTVVSKNGGLFAEKIELESALVQSTEKWLEDIIDKIGIAQYSRLQNHLYVSKYRKIIQNLNNKHWKDIRNLCVFFTLILFLLFNWSYTDRDYGSTEDRPEKTDYSPYGGWTYE